MQWMCARKLMEREAGRVVPEVGVRSWTGVGAGEKVREFVMLVRVVWAKAGAEERVMAEVKVEMARSKVREATEGEEVLGCNVMGVAVVGCTVAGGRVSGDAVGGEILGWWVDVGGTVMGLVVGDVGATVGWNVAGEDVLGGRVGGCEVGAMVGLAVGDVGIVVGWKVVGLVVLGAPVMGGTVGKVVGAVVGVVGATVGWAVVG
eukprot:gene4278-5264_t